MTNGSNTHAAEFELGSWPSEAGWLVTALWVADIYVAYTYNPNYNSVGLGSLCGLATINSTMISLAVGLQLANPHRGLAATMQCDFPKKLV